MSDGGGCDDAVDTLGQYASILLLSLEHALAAAAAAADEDESYEHEVNSIVMTLSWMCRDARDLFEQNDCCRLPAYHFLKRSAYAMHAVFGSATPRNVLIQGPAGCGKTTLTNRIFKWAREELKMDAYMLAPTQAAAELLDSGQTIHSFLHMRKTDSIAELEAKFDRFIEYGRYASLFAPKDPYPHLLVIDEISMVGDSLLAALDFVLRNRNGGDPTRLFGGVCVVCVGDFCQLPPVAAKKAFEWEQWAKFRFVKVHLEHPLRQSEDLAWFNYLQRVRCGGVRYYSENDGGPARISEQEYEQIMSVADAHRRPVILSAVNAAVEELNAREFNRLKAPIEESYRASDYLVRRSTEHLQDGRERLRWTRVTDQEPQSQDIEKIEKSYRLPSMLSFKVGAKYIITYNICKADGLYNGLSCVYVGRGMFEYKRRDGVTDKVERVSTTRLSSMHTVPTGREPNLFVCRAQLALRLGYAQTIHKSQGMTMSSVVLDLRKIRCPGQYYVACSRVRSRNDIRVLSPTTTKLSISGAVLAYVFGGGDGNNDDDDDDDCENGDDDVMNL
jgi:ATP-dependent DNA helicase PIF1